MFNRDVNYQTSVSQGLRMDDNNAANNMLTGISSNYRTYDPSSSRFTTVAATRASVIDPQKSFSNLSGSGRFSTSSHFFANSSSQAATANRISYLAPSASRPNVYYSGQESSYANLTKATFANQSNDGLNFYRFSDGNKVVIDQLKNADRHWIWYSQANVDNNLLTISSAGAISKIEVATIYQDNTTNPTTPLLFQTHGGIPENGTTTWRTDYSRDSGWQADSRDTYIIYRPNFGANVQLPADVEIMGEWRSNMGGQRSGS